MQHVLELENLSKQYSNGRGIHALSLQIGQGEIFGLLGPNGAGKSTAIRTLLGLLTPDSGRASVAGHDIVAGSLAVRRVTGYLPSENPLYLDLTGRQSLEFALQVRGAKSGLQRGQELAEQLGVDLGVRLRTLSHGQRQKVSLIVALAHRPEVLILDEPTAGLDPLVQEVFFRLLREYRDSGTTILMSSHVLSEVETLCGRVGILRDGRLVAVDTIEALRRTRVKRVAATFRGMVPQVSSWPGVQEVWSGEGSTRFCYHGPLAPLLERLACQPLVDLTLQDPSLEEVFRAFYSNAQEPRGA